MLVDERFRIRRRERTCAAGQQESSNGARKRGVIQLHGRL
jgi:hypothetical protein